MGQLFRHDIGIDLGTSRILLCATGKGILFDEPSVAAVERAGGRIIAMGKEAEALGTHLPAGVTLIKPMREGVISNFDITARMLRTFFTSAAGKHLFFTPRALICMPSTVSEAEKRCIVEATLEAGARYCFLIDEPVAAALGEKVDLSGGGHMIVDIGGGSTDIAVLSSGCVLLSDSIRTAGSDITAAIVRWLAVEHELFVGEDAGEQIKLNFGRAWPAEEQFFTTIEGRSAATGESISVPIGSNELIEAIREPLDRIVNCISGLLDRLPDSVLDDIRKEGILLTGGGARLAGLHTRVTEMTGFPCHAAEEPDLCVIRGISYALDNFSSCSDYMYTYRRGDYLGD